MSQPLTFHRARPVEVPWTCDKRGDCCTRFPDVVMTGDEAKGIIAAVTPEKAESLRWSIDSQGFVHLQARPCPLLDANGLCSVYDVRPYNCRRFSCNRVGDEAWGQTPSGECLNLIERLQQSRAVRRAYARQQRKAQNWARAHGWDDDRQRNPA